MKGGSKYQPLLEYLRCGNQREVTLSFAQIELVINDNLPESARRSKAWWSNRTTGGLQASAWMEAGYRAKVNLSAETVTFRKKSPTTYQVEQPMTSIIEWNKDTIKAMRLHMGLTQKELATQLRVRQQTVSDWENGVHPPDSSNLRSLNLVAEQSSFTYGEET